jgi:hypothetical protein
MNDLTLSITTLDKTAGVDTQRTQLRWEKLLDRLNKPRLRNHRSSLKMHYPTPATTKLSPRLPFSGKA